MGSSEKIQEETSGQAQAQASGRVRIFGLEDGKLEENGRTVIPKKMRAKLGSFVVTVGALGCIELYPEANWEIRCAQVEALESGFDPTYDKLSTLFFSAAEDGFEADNAGRFVLPLRFRKDAGFVIEDGDKPVFLTDAVFTANGPCIQIWTKQKFAEFKASPENYQSNQHAAMKGLISKLKDEQRLQKSGVQ